VRIFLTEIQTDGYDLPQVILIHYDDELTPPMRDRLVVVVGLMGSEDPVDFRFLGIQRGGDY